MLPKSTLTPLLLLLTTLPSQVSASVNCLDIISEECDSIENILGDGTCRITSVFGPMISRCLAPGEFMFNKALTKHGRFQEPIRAVCSGNVVKTGMLLRKKQGFAAVTEHPFARTCQFNGKEYDTFQIYYGHANGADGPFDVETVEEGEIFAYLNTCDTCVGMGKQAILMVLLKIGDDFVNPMALSASATDAIYSGMLVKEDADLRLELSGPCEALTLNRYEIYCGSKEYVFDANLRQGFADDVYTSPPHVQDTSKPYFDPMNNPFYDGDWHINLVIPQSWMESETSCTVVAKDLWGATKWSGTWDAADDLEGGLEGPEDFMMTGGDEPMNRWAVCLASDEECGSSSSEDADNGRRVVPDCTGVDGLCRGNTSCRICEGFGAGPPPTCMCKDKSSVCHMASISVNACKDKKLCGSKCAYAM